MRITYNDWTVWKQLIQEEPRLELLRQELLSIAKRVKGKRNFCALWVWYERVSNYKEKCCRLVGMDREDDPVSDLLKSSKAYDCAYHILFETLPDCRHDGKDCMEVKHLQRDLYS